MKRPLRIFLIGFSGTGKSQTAPVVAQMLGWDALDTDTMVEEEAGMSIPQIFELWGEAWFRQAESRALAKASQRQKVVIATGGGIILRPENRRLMAEKGFVVCLEAHPQTILSRLATTKGTERPLLAAHNPLLRIQSLKARRQPFYALADYIVRTDHLTPEEVAREVVRAWRKLSGEAFAQPDRLTPAHDTLFPDAACVVETPSGAYPVYLGRGLLDRLGELLAPLAKRAFIITDATVMGLYGEEVVASLQRADLQVEATSVPPGEATKSLDTAASLLEWLTRLRAQRGDLIVALGGGMITDLAGFVAATYARGLALANVPTTLLAMVDAALGGKTGVNLPIAKNMVGAFYHPSIVVADLSTLTTLGERELREGWAETIKHAFIADPDLLSLLERDAQGLLALAPGPTEEAIRRSMAVKASVVAEDEREQTGRRSVLNYGHTIGHAIEAATEYATYLHGEAISIGMVAEAELGLRLGLTPHSLAQQQRQLLERFGLPTSATGIPREALWQAMALDKKGRGGKLRWVILKGVADPVVITDPPASLVKEVLDHVLGT